MTPIVHLSSNRSKARSYVGGVCGNNTKDRERATEIVPFLSCNKDVNNLKSTNKLTGLSWFNAERRRSPKATCCVPCDDKFSSSHKTWIRAEVVPRSCFVGVAWKYFSPLKCTDSHKDMIDYRSCTHILSSCEIKAWKKILALISQLLQLCG